MVQPLGHVIKYLSNYIYQSMVNNDYQVINSKFRLASLVSAFLLLMAFKSELHAQTLMQRALDAAGSATVTAATSGNWTSTATWGGSLPGTNARVLIPAGITVTVDSEISTEFKSIRILGKLEFARNANTELRVEYVVSGMNGELEVGTVGNPIPSNRIAKIVIADRGGTSTSLDPERFAPGMVLMGSTKMHGQQKTSHVALGVQPGAGANSLTLATTPTNWAANDQLVLAGTVPDNLVSDEVVTINSINGTNVTLTSSLAFPHQAPSQASHLDVHVANLTRNIKISSENPSVSAKLRGHIMFMHTLDVDVRYVELTNMGRTDKKQKLDDYTWNQLQESPSYVPPRGAYTNPRGRYSIHFHRGGINPALTPAICQGVTVNNDPGWGYVNHSSRVDIMDNVSYNVVGGAFNTESGDETGSFRRNIAIRTVNDTYPMNNLSDTVATIDIREEVQDYAWQGDGFWLHSAGLTIEDNIVSGCSGNAYIFWPEGLIENGLGMMRGTPAYHVPDPAMRALLTSSAMTSKNYQMEIWDIPAQPFRNNTGYNVTKGLVGYYFHTRFHDADNTVDPDEEKFNIPPKAYKDQLQAVFEGTKMWNIIHKGVEFVFSTNITLKNTEIYGYGSRPTSQGIDMNAFFNMEDFAYENVSIYGFDQPNQVGFNMNTQGNITVDGGTFDNASKDIVLWEPQSRATIDQPNDGGTDWLRPGSTSRTLVIQNVTVSDPSPFLYMEPQLRFEEEIPDGSTDSEANRDLNWFLLQDDITLNFGVFNNTKLYYDAQAANFTPITNANFQSTNWDPDDGPNPYVVPTKYRNKTNQQLSTTSGSNGSSFGGEILPASAVGHSMIVGGKVGAVSSSTFDLTTIASGNGTVSPSGTTSHGSGASVQVTATPAAGYQFDGWSGAVTGTTNPIAILMDGNKTVTATFSQISSTQYTLTSSAGVGGSVSPSGQNVYNEGTVVDLTATPDPGFQFDGWAGDASGTLNPLPVTIDADKTISATFSAVPQFTLTTNAGTGGSVSPSGTNNYNGGTVVAVTATPSTGYQFSGWTGDATGTANPLNVTVDANKTISANFTLIPPSSLTAESGTVTVSTSGYVTVNLSKSYNSPVVVATPVLPATSTAPVVSRVRNVTGSSFQVKVQNPSGATVSNITVQYLVVEAGTYTSGADGVQMEAKTVTSSITGRKSGWTLETESYNQSYTNPVVLGQVMSANDADWSVFYASSGSRTSPPTSGALRAGKHVGEDSNTTRANETIGLIIIEAGSGSFDSISYQASVGADIVRGPGNSTSGYTYSHSVSGATGAILSAAGMDGGDGGFPVLLGGNAVSGSNIVMTFDEDQVGDSERSHTTEQVAYLVFADGAPPVQYTLTANAGTGGSVSGGGTYNSGTIVQVTATPDTGYQFDGWSGDAGGTTNPVDVTMDGNKTVTASFSLIPPTQYTLTTSATSGGSVTAGGTYNAGQVVNITATPDAGYQFDGWSGDASGTTNPLAVTMDANKTITANFSFISTGTWIKVDERSFTYDGGWENVNNANNAYQNTAKFTDEGGAFATYTFTGTKVALFLWREDTQTVQVSIDGGASTNVNLGSGSASSERVWESATLSAGTHTIRMQYQSGGVNLDAIEYLGSSGLRPAVEAPVNQELSIELYPNPVEADHVNVVMTGIDGEASLSLIDMSGRELSVKSVKLKGRKSIQRMDLSQLATGTYIIKVLHEAGEKSLRFIKR